jgi:transcriptional regulator with XRE-family HTH domain
MKENHKISIAIIFGNRIRALRKARGLSQESFAELAGLDRSYIGGVERGERNISLNNIQKVASGLSLSIAELFED